MDKMIISGGVPLQGEVTVSGAKNAALPILASTLLGSGVNQISNVPKVADIRTIRKLLQWLGGKITDQDGDIQVEFNRIERSEAPYDMVKTMRASILVLGPLLARVGEAIVSLPGGCAIGARPVNLTLSALEKMGTEVRIEQGYIKARAKKLKGARIYFDMPTVTGTENIMMAATLAEGTTVIENAACEPEISDLARFLTLRGASIHGAGTETITIHGVPSLGCSSYTVMPDRIEAGTFIMAGAITGGDLFVRRAVPWDLKAVLIKLGEAGVVLEEDAAGVRVRSGGEIRPVDVKTSPYPGFPTDLQAQMMSLMAVSKGVSIVTETIFENRFNHVAELRRMGADIQIHGNQAVVRGAGCLSGAPVMASDLRASASLVLAGLAAEGETEISRIYHLDRGYERMEEKLRPLGARIQRNKEP
ncbi:MAG TPA: UDP-N-acetylglucosamine 1-carboxyvinyltransferase [Nitrospiria bacterium]|nr:UDP-N-acetylglucosamine 1-carboxyvinyltransferase [Nitrospiria bacterium]